MPRLRALQSDGSAHVAWIANGLGQEVDRAFAEALQQLGGLQVIEQPAAARVRLILTPKVEGETLQVPVQRVAVPKNGKFGCGPSPKTDASSGAAKPCSARAKNRHKLSCLCRVNFAIRSPASKSRSSNAGETFLVDERWRRRPVGIVSGSAETDQPLLSSIYYLDRALRPFAEVRQGTITELFKREVAVVVLADIGQVLELRQSHTGRLDEKGRRYPPFRRPPGWRLRGRPGPSVPSRRWPRNRRRDVVGPGETATVRGNNSFFGS